MKPEQLDMFAPDQQDRLAKATESHQDERNTADVSITPPPLTAPHSESAAHQALEDWLAWR